MAMDPRIDAYIARQADFARPILIHIRALMHAASPDIGEAVKWGMPFFTYRDQNLANMAAFKGHAAFGFWHDKVGREDASDDAMGQFGRLTALSDLPSDAAIAGLIAQAMALIDAGDRPRTGPKPPKAPLPVHPAFADAIALLLNDPIRCQRLADGARRNYTPFRPDAYLARLMASFAAARAGFGRA
jgi:hypothetical protein